MRGLDFENREYGTGKNACATFSECDFDAFAQVGGHVEVLAFEEVSVGFDEGAALFFAGEGEFILRGGGGAAA